MFKGKNVSKNKYLQHTWTLQKVPYKMIKGVTCRFAIKKKCAIFKMSYHFMAKLAFLPTENSVRVNKASSFAFLKNVDIRLHCFFFYNNHK